MVRWGRKQKFDDALHALPPATRRRLDRSGDRFDVPAGAILLSPGTRVRWAWIVLSGELVVDSAFRVETIGAGRQWGATQVLMRDRRHYQAVARTASSLIAIPERQLTALLATDAAFASWMTRRLAHDSLALRDELVLRASLQVAA